MALSKCILFLIALFVLLCSLPGLALADAYVECPDCARSCSINCFGWECDSSKIPVCTHSTEDHDYVSNSVYREYKWVDAPFDGSTIGSYIIESTSARLYLKGRHSSYRSYPDTDLRIYVYDCSQGAYEYVRKFGFDNEISTFSVDVTGLFEECGSEFKIKLMLNDEQYQVWLYEAWLGVQYEKVPYGMEASMSTSGLPPSGEISKTDSFNVHADIQCGWDSCGQVNAELQYKEKGSTSGFLTMSSGTSGLISYQQNPYSCGSVGSGDPCTFTWTVYGADKGDYTFRIKADSDLDQMETAYSSEKQVSVMLGEVRLENVYFDPVTLSEPGLQTILYATVTCSDYWCGPVDVYAKNGSSKLTDDQYFSISGDNPETITPSPGSPASVSWDITPKTSGLHTGIYLVADPDEQSIAFHTMEPEQDLLVLEPEPESGYLVISSSSLSPSQILEGESSTLSGTVKCSGGPCGEVSAKAMQSGSPIPTSSGGITVQQNALSCGTMSDGDDCSVSWEISGNSDGSYPEINILAESIDDSVVSAQSPFYELSVMKPPGELQVSASIDPSEINVSDTSTLAGTVTCSNDNCGMVTAYLKEYGGEIIGSSGGISTTGDNPVECSGLPCQLTWNIAGNQAGIYDIFVDAQSTVSTGSSSGVKTLRVTDPEISEQPMLHASAVSDVSCTAGQAVSVHSDISCYDARCGDVSAYLEAYMDGKWTLLGPGTAVSCGDNERSFQLSAGDSRTEAWEFTAEEGRFDMRLRAESSLAGGVDRYFSVDSAEESDSVLNLEVISPESGDKLSRGDMLEIEIYVTENFYPLNGIEPTATLSGGISETLALEGMGGGRYSSSTHVSLDAAGRTDITIDALDASKQTHVIIDPKLDVSMQLSDSALNISERLEITGSVMKKGRPYESASLSLGFRCSGWRSSVGNVELGEDGNFEYSYRLPRDMPEGACTAEAFASDGFGNSGNASSAFMVSRTKEEAGKSVYNISFISPSSGASFSVYEEFMIELRVTRDGEFLEGADVRCTDPIGNFNIILNETLESYEAWVEANMPPSGEVWNLRCEAETPDGFYGSRFMDIRVRPVLVIDVIEPDRKSFEKGESADFKVQVFRNGIPLSEGNVYMTVNDEVIDLEYSRNGIFEKEYVFMAEGDYVFEVIAHDSRGNIESIPLSITTLDPVRINWLAIALSGSGIIILGLLWLFHNSRKSKTVVKTVTRTVTRTVVKKPDRKAMLREKLRDLEKERDAIQKAKEDCEMEYYQRRITEQEFKKIMENYEQEILKLDAEIREFSQELGDD